MSRHRNERTKERVRQLRDAGPPLSGWREASRTACVCLMFLALPLLNGCGRVADDFRGDTVAGRIQLDVEAVENGAIDEVSDLRLLTQQRAYERVLAPTWPVGAEVTVTTSVAEFGRYRRGGGWISKGDLFVGRHAVWATTVAVNSSNPEILFAQIDVRSESPARNRVRLSARATGMARISFKVQALDAAGRVIAETPVEDSVTITVR